MQSNNQVWEHPALSFAEADGFIRNCLPKVTKVEGPVSIFANYNDGPDLRITALFITDDPNHPRVVVKANRFSFLQGSRDAHRIVAQTAPRLTPELLGAQGSLLLHEFFEGTSVAEVGTAHSLIEAVRALSHIQEEATEAANEPTNLEVITVEQLPDLFTEVLGVIRAHFEDSWKIDPEGKIAKAMGFPDSEVLDRLEPLIPEVNDWASALAESSLHLSLDHGDCHTGNSALLQDGRVIVYDWENASIAHPYLSVEKLMTSGWGLDVGAKGGPWGYVRDTPTQDDVRDHYLKEFGMNFKRERGSFDAAMCLAVIKEMRHEMEWARLCGWHQNPEWTAQLVNRLFQHRSRFQAGNFGH